MMIGMGLQKEEKKKLSGKRRSGEKWGWSVVCEKKKLECE